MDKADLIKILPTIPVSPGCYMYSNQEGKIIYVGKAKNLRNRVRSYFSNPNQGVKTRRLVASIAKIDYTVVSTESDALLLENNLIKQFQPRYNILLKDDKSYAKIVVTRETFPRVFVTRQVLPGVKVYGPYTNTKVAYAMVDVIRKSYKLRTCRLALTEESVSQRRHQICLQYHIKRCDGACVGEVSREEYMDRVRAAEELLRGNLKACLEQEEAEMMKQSALLAFEKAEECRQRLELLRNYQHKSTIATHIPHDVDVFAYDEDDRFGYVNMMHLHQGSIVVAHTTHFKKSGLDGGDDVFSQLITELRKRFKSHAQEVVLRDRPDWEGDDYTITIAQTGERKKLLELSERNVKQYRQDLIKRSEKLNPEQRTMRLLTKMREELGVTALPRHIECFDNSNIQGTSPVASCVVFKNGKPSKKDYRKFHVKTVVGADDFMSMREIVYRRYRRLLDDDEPLPDLIVIDGGKGQLRMVVETLQELDLLGRIEVCSLAKRYEEVYFPYDSDPVILPKDSETLRVLMHIRDEAHRFGITFHRDVRSKKQTVSVLDSIKGIGKESKKKLLSELKSIQGIQKADLNQLTAVVGAAKARAVYEFFHGEANREYQENESSYTTL